MRCGSWDDFVGRVGKKGTKYGRACGKHSTDMTLPSGLAGIYLGDGVQLQQWTVVDFV